MTEQSHPDIVLRNATFFRGNIDKPVLLGTEALAICRGRVAALGRNDDILHMAGAGTKNIDLGGRLVVPGFIDSHIHFYEWALKRRDLHLDDLGSLEELLARIEKSAHSLAPGEWIMGQGWNETDWKVPHQPDRRSLDQVAPNHPVLLWRCDLHLAVTNSAALRLAGITRSTLDPPEGKIERDAAGEPTGILRELSINLVRRAIAEPKDDQVIDALTFTKLA
jgi:hypothetical protein